MLYRTRLRNRLLQAMYRPRRSRILLGNPLLFLDELDSHIEEKITPLLTELF